MDAALTGHLCFSTIHAPSSLRTYTRLIEMGVPPYMVVESITLAISQRLARGVHSCARIEEPNAEERVVLERWGAPMEAVAHATGCAGCNNTGYRGRLAIAEMLSPSQELKSLILERPSLVELTRAAKAEGFVTLFDDALRHIREGRTTVAEIGRTIEAEMVEESSETDSTESHLLDFEAAT
jgi:type II secretory ATPase GspE/PulE/Tfp pilus assembly ATPase PilB-like protein